jgi:predicted RNA-binding protein (virulence factor B family)
MTCFRSRCPRFGVGRKAFKQALGALFKAKWIEFTKPGNRIVYR